MTLPESAAWMSWNRFCWLVSAAKALNLRLDNSQ